MILDTIVIKTKERIEKQKKKVTLEELQQECLKVETKPSFLEALQKEEMSYILEVKKASPSKGLITESFDYIATAKEYERIGASAISVLTEPYFFQGENQYLQAISKEVSIPVLRKDFVIDKYMIYEAKVFGASAILLICRIVDDQQLQEYLEIARSLCLDCLVETRNAEEIQRAVNAGAKIIGVNNRDLQTFQVDIEKSISLRSQVPENIIFVSESGISTYHDIQRLYQNHVQAVLIGEAMMRANDKQAMIDRLEGQYEEN